MFRPAGRNIELPESPVSEKGKRISNIEYNGTLKYERYFLRKPPSFLTPKPYPLAPKTYVAAVAITAANAGVQAYVAGETGGGNNGAIAGAANAAISTITCRKHTKGRKRAPENRNAA
ncbi:hypothetical protein [Leptospira alexanderi]|uniref:hypothetical protein n=1 Tax=Leptospira alexanderi TaxID=100053 RepID=UPI0020149481|nr:hypothetical protein [Leptospira alexanderi]